MKKSTTFIILVLLVMTTLNGSSEAAGRGFLHYKDYCGITPTNCLFNPWACYLCIPNSPTNP